MEISSVDKSPPRRGCDPWAPSIIRMLSSSAFSSTAPLFLQRSEKDSGCRDSSVSMYFASQLKLALEQAQVRQKAERGTGN